MIIEINYVGNEANEEPQTLDDIKIMAIDTQTKQLIDDLKEEVADLDSRLDAVEEGGSGGGSELPTPTDADAGKAVVVDEEGKYVLGEAGGNIPIYAIYSEGSSIEYCGIIGDFTEAYQNWQNNVPMLFTISQAVGTGGDVFTGVLPAYRYDSNINRFVIAFSSISGFYWSAEGIEYWVD